jgi:arsenate reductase
VSDVRKRVLFVCIGNSCRSQMAEAFARVYGSDVIIPASAGLAAAAVIAPDTMQAMHDKSIDLRDQFPKSLRHMSRVQFDLVVNMSGEPLPGDLKRAREVDWEVPDPVTMSFDEHCEIRDLIERRVMQLILELRRAQTAPQFKGQGSEWRP